MTKEEILEGLGDPEAPNHPAWAGFCDLMKEYNYGGSALETAWHFYGLAWHHSKMNAMVVYAYNTIALEDAVRIATAVRDDARASSQRYLDQKRSVEQEMSALQQDRHRMGREIEHLTLTLNSTKYQLEQANKEIDVLKRGADITLDVTRKYGCGVCSIKFDSMAELAEHTRKHHTQCHSFHWQYRCDRCEDHATDGEPEHRTLGDDGTVYTWRS